MKKAVSPLPPIDGLAPSCVALCPGPWDTMLAFLEERFPYLEAGLLQTRLAAGEIYDDAAQPVAADAPFVAGGYLWYYRAVRQETRVPFEIDILYQDERIIVVDKPHFLSTIPAGRFVKETALVRLRVLLGIQEIAPMHRLDRETAGVLLFCLDPASRSAYQQLFESREVQKQYEAIAPYRAELDLPLVHRSRLERASGEFFTMAEVAGEPNSETKISLIERQGAWARYFLEPHTGKKHQLRAHLAALDIPIVNDPWYPVVLDEKGDDFSKPLQLLARELRFIDPFTQEARCFRSQRTLLWPIE
ncbi:pseudouridine synthase [Chitinibacter bivalviorum]|uniref:Pseudouridine synthase n=1 Tax=Chitinibacter bivalviorum TaxID=2739434 RepID=A0A7H9BJK2_9NEIS|nr:pseudouridine synthase [Chitinibacter bivalviorum]QLG88840.1 pseudouridine synthase [Chitinibacter bivalviorum]